MKINFDFADTIKGFLEKDEAIRLYKITLKAARLGPCLEIGSYCGKSAYFIGTACKERNSILFSIDHHHGSLEQQPGQEYFDKELFDEKQGIIDTFRFFKNTLKKACLLDTVVPIVAESKIAAKKWSTLISMLFIDGEHIFETALNDYLMWSKHIMPGGFLVIHDIFMDPGQGGQAPRKIYEKALESGKYKKLEITNTLGVLKRF
ncbi:MAG: hypothetical protein B6I26_06765 [Desulfobacteraceae bacterium 4572_130]|nr:MAG: hypothetical protein B6I26_06765 [Desulfobacteraceae bacterium 4572_130]